MLSENKNAFMLHDCECPQVKDRIRILEIGFHTEHQAALRHLRLKRSSNKFVLCNLCCKTRILKKQKD